MIDSRRKLETQAIIDGFKNKANLEALRYLNLIKTHDMLAALLNECPRHERQAMLDAIRAYLPFEAYSVDHYETMMAQKFEAWEEKRNRMIRECNEQLGELFRQHGGAYLIELKCHKCSRTASFAGESPVGAIILARQDGWVREKASNKEVCPKCECEDRGKRKKCPGCARRHYAPDCRVLAHVEPGAPSIVGQAREGVMDVGTGKVN